MTFFSFTNKLVARNLQNYEKKILFFQQRLIFIYFSQFLVIYGFLRIVPSVHFSVFSVTCVSIISIASKLVNKKIEFYMIYELFCIDTSVKFALFIIYV